MNEADADDPYVKAGRWISAPDPEPNHELLRAIAGRRLTLIAETLELPPDHFRRAHEAARQTLGGAQDEILSEQARRIAEALPEVSDVLVRDRIVGLMAVLMDDEDAAS